MATVKFTKALQHFFPDLQAIRIQSNTVKELVEALNEKHPGIKHYLLDDQDQLREHINIFIGEELVRDRKKLQDPITPQDEVYIFQALSGG